jgi:peptidoglycan hydrolase CwlO-like protein
MNKDEENLASILSNLVSLSTSTGTFDATINRTDVVEDEQALLQLLKGYLASYVDKLLDESEGVEELVKIALKQRDEEITNLKKEIEELKKEIETIKTFPGIGTPYPNPYQNPWNTTPYYPPNYSPITFTTATT